MAKFPKDVSKKKLLKALERLGFRVIRQAEHIALLRENPDGTSTPMTIPNHKQIKSSTLRSICTQAGIDRAEFLQAFTK